MVLKVRHVIMSLCFVSSLAVFAVICIINLSVPVIRGQTDVLVLLAGHYEGKVAVLADLFHKGVAGKILLANDGVKSKWSREHQRNLYNIEWTEEELVAKGVPRAAIVKLEFKKSGTIHDAIAVRNYLLRHDIKSITLVTYDFHASRTFWAFRRVLRGSQIEIRVYSIKTQSNGVTAKIVETLKQVYYLIRYCPVLP